MTYFWGMFLGLEYYVLVTEDFSTHLESWLSIFLRNFEEFLWSFLGFSAKTLEQSPSVLPGTHEDP